MELMWSFVIIEVLRWMLEEKGISGGVVERVRERDLGACKSKE